jgi:hypothetical protein
MPVTKAPRNNKHFSVFLYSLLAAGVARLPHLVPLEIWRIRVGIWVSLPVVMRAFLFLHTFKHV